MERDTPPPQVEKWLVQRVRWWEAGSEARRGRTVLRQSWSAKRH